MITRMNNVGLMVDDLKAAIAFFVELGLELEGETTVEGLLVDRCVGRDGVRGDIAMHKTPDGHSRLELSEFHTSPAITAEPNAPSTGWACVASCSPSTTSTTSWPAYVAMAPNRSAKWCSTRTSTGCVISAAPRHDDPSLSW
jgi:hypothetical protein